MGYNIEIVLARHLGSSLASGASMLCDFGQVTSL